MMKSWFSGIFGFFFSRAAIAVISFAIILLLILLPFFKKQLLQMVESQGRTFANSTIAATTTNLYTESYGDVIEYLNKVLRDTDNILFVVITNSKGSDIVVTKNEWHETSHLFKDETSHLGMAEEVLHFEINPVTNQPCFMYHKVIEIGGVPWGMLTVGMSDRQYQFIKQQYTLIVATVSTTLVFVLLLLFYRSSKKIRTEIATLSATGLELQRGNLGARALEDGAGEIGTLSKAINIMAINLQEKTNRIQQLAQIVEQTNDVFVLFDSTLKVVFVNEAIQEVTGYSSHHFVGMTLMAFADTLKMNIDDMLHELDYEQLSGKNTSTKDLVLVKKDGLHVDVELRLELIVNEASHEPNFLIVLSNIASRKVMEKELHQLAFYDKLTDLPNRRMFMDYLRTMIKKSERNKKSFALFFMDLDNFKLINDTQGHEVGDVFLTQIANRLRMKFRGNDIIARLGGDEFTILISDVSDEHHIHNIAEKLISDLASKPLELGGTKLSISTSLGVAIYPKDGLDSDTLLRHADIAMYAAKKSGKSRFAFFKEEMNDSLRGTIEIEHDLKEALHLGNQIKLFYQPIIHLKTKELVGVEALVRWQHPVKGFISPLEFIPIAERSDLIVSLSDYLLDVAFKQVRNWNNLASTLYMSVNISVRLFESPEFVKKIAYVLDSYGVRAEQIQLEFTESIMLDMQQSTIDRFEQLKGMGFKIAIDDFGTGYSSLGYIHKLPIDVIKIDQSFVQGMLDSKKTNSIVAAIVKLSNNLDIKTIAEGVETNEQVERLMQHQCEYGQGYLYDKALSLEEFEAKYLTKDRKLTLVINN
jgi:diguanylate cyclase (GGDEF)-like protein/PAS domain S-box-containing protein